MSNLNSGVKSLNARNSGLDILKAICAFMIVAIHAPFEGALGEYFIALSRIAVPVFFMISGYFFLPGYENNKTAKSLKKLLKLFITANFLFMLFGFAMAFLKGSPEEFYGLFTIKNMLDFILFNSSPFYGHLWYLGAIIYTVLIYYFAFKGGKEKYIYRLIPLLLLSDLIFGKYSLLIFGREFPTVYIRNFIFVGVPYFGLGVLIFKNNEKLKNISKNKLIIFTIMLIALNILERYMLVAFNVNAVRDHYIMSTILAVIVFVMFIKLYEGKNLNKLELFMAKTGREYSTDIYIFHPIFIVILFFASKVVGVYDIYKYIAPIAVYIVSVIFSSVLSLILRKKK